MKRTWNKVLSWLLTMVMLVTSFEGFTVPVLAEDSTTLSVNAISANGFAENGNSGKTLADALSVSLNAGDELTLSFNSAVVSSNGVEEADKTVSWNLADEADLAAIGFTVSCNGNKCEVSTNAAISGNKTFKLTASYNGATPESQDIYFQIVVNAVEEPPVPPAPVSANEITVSVNGFDENGKDGSSLENAYSVSVSLNDPVNVSFNAAVVSYNGAKLDDTVSFNLTPAELPAGLESSISGNEFTISGNATASVNASYKLSVSCDDADTVDVFFTIIVKNEEESSDPITVSSDAITVSANGFDKNGKDGSSSANALSVTVSVNEAVNVSFNAATVSANGTVLSGNTVSFNLTAADGSAAELPAGLASSVSGNDFAISGNATASANASYKLSVSCDGFDTKEVFFNIIVKEEEETQPAVSVDKVTISANGFKTVAGKDGKSKDTALILTASLNVAISVSFDAATVSANGTVISGNTVSFNLTAADGTEAKLLEGLTASVSGNVFTVSGSVAVSSNGAYKLSASCNGFETASVYFDITVGEVKQDNPIVVTKTGISIEGLEEEYGYTGAKIVPAFEVVDNDRDVILAKGVDYTVKITDNKKVGTATITVNGKGNYEGKNVTAKFAIKAPADFAGVDKSALASSVKSIAKISFKPAYTGEAQYPETLVVKTKDGDLTMTHVADGEYTSSTDKTVAITVANNVNKGTAVVAATGADGKTKKKTFKITPAQLPTDGYTAAAAVYAVKGAKPASITGEFGNTTIVLGQDFTAKYGNNKAVGTGTATLKGKGNFKGSATVTFDIEALDLDEIAVNAAPGKKANAKLVTVADGNGAQIPAKLLKVTFEGANGKLAAGQEFTVTVTGDGTNITGTAIKTIKVGSAKKAKAVVKKGYTVQYTGEPIDLEALDVNPFESGDISVEGLKYGTDYEVAAYINNTNKGTMKVVLQGISDKFTGTAVAKVKIVAKTMKAAD